METDMKLKALPEVGCQESQRDLKTRRKELGGSMKTNSLIRNYFLLSAASTKERTNSWMRFSRVWLYVFALFACTCGIAVGSPAPFVIQGPTIVQNNCTSTLSICGNISYPANSPITTNQRVVQLNTGNLLFEVPVISNIPSTAAVNLQVGFYVRVTAEGGALGEVQTNSAQTVLSGAGSAMLQIPIPVEWAESEVRFQISYWVSGDKVFCTPRGCKSIYFDPRISTTGPDLSSIALSIPAPTNLDGVLQSSGSFPADAFLVLVTPQAAFQLHLQPVGLVYGPVGNEGDAIGSMTFTEVSGTNQEFSNSQNSTIGLTQDDQTNYQGNVTLSFSGTTNGCPDPTATCVKVGLSFSGSWDNSVENDQQFSTSSSILTNHQQTSRQVIQVPPAPNEPPLSEVTYYTQPFFQDTVLAVINSHYAVWSYPNAPVVQPIGNNARGGFIELPIRLLDSCYRTPSAIQPTSSNAGLWQPLHSYAVGTLIAVNNTTVLQVVTTAGISGSVSPNWNTANGATTGDGTVTWTNETAHLIPVNNAQTGVEYDWLDSSHCQNLASIDNFWVQGSQSATPYAFLADGSSTGTLNTGDLTQYDTLNSFSTTVTQDGSVQVTSKVTSIGTSSQGLTADIQRLLDLIGINLSFGSSSSTTETYTTMNMNETKTSQNQEGAVEALNSIHDSLNPPAELVVNAIWDAYFGGMALQLPSMKIPLPSGAAVRQPGVFDQNSVQENLPGYRIVRPEKAVDRDNFGLAHEAAALRHPNDDPLPIPELGQSVPLALPQQ